MEKDSKIFICGHRGMVGSALLRKLQQEGFTNFVLKTSKELDLTNQKAVANFFEKEKPEYIFLAAAKVGGILANDSYPADFIYDNLCIQNNIIHEAWRTGVKKLLFLGSSCIYPKNAAQPIKEEYLLTGLLEPTNDAYAVAKIAGIKMCQAYRKQYGCNFISVMPTNLYGMGDNYNLHHSHVLPALIRKIHEAKIKDEKTVTVWGTGNPKREFLHVDDAAEACYFLMENYADPEIINVGFGKDESIAELAASIKNIIGYNGRLEFDTSKPDGTMRKVMDVKKLNSLGWHPSIALEDGIRKTYEDFVENYDRYAIG